MKRRDFLKYSVASAAALTMRQTRLQAGLPNPDDTAPLPKRPYGRNGIELSIIGLGGLTYSRAEQPRVQQIVDEAIARGVNYFDVAPTYGEAEVKLGPALEPYRKDVFLACKTTERKADAAKVEFERSLERLRTDYFDLYQLHAITDVEKDVDGAFADDGVMPWLIEQHKAGRVRHLGFSAHSVSAAMTALDRYDFDSILWPVNFAAYQQGDFGPQVVEKAVKQGVCVLALKTLAKQKWTNDEDRNRSAFSGCWYEPLSDPREASLGLRFTLNEPVTAALPPANEDLWRLAVNLAANVDPLNAEEQQELRAMADGLDPIFTNA